MNLSLIGSGYLTHHILGFEDDGKLIGLMMAAEGLVTDGGVEKAGEAECLVVPESFQVTPQRLRTHIDAKYRLGLGPNRHGSPFAVFSGRATPLNCACPLVSFDNPVPEKCHRVCRRWTGAWR